MNKTLFNVAVAAAIAIFIGAWFYAGNIKPRYTTEAEADAQAIQDRIRPLAEVAIEGVEPGPVAPASGPDPAATEVIDTADKPAGTMSAPVPAVAEVIDTARQTAAAAVAQVPVVADVVDTVQQAATTTDSAPAAATTKLGEDTYKMACFACHMTGAAGAPKLGDIEAWVPRIAQGIDVLNERALKGFQGSTGMMPPKGGRVDLPDEAIVAAVAYMVQESGGP